MAARSPIRRLCATSLCGTAVLALALAGSLPGCSSLAPRDFSRGTPIFDPQVFFTGRTRSWGVFENRAGAPVRRFTTVSLGRRKGAALDLEQTFTYDDGSTQHRHWRIRRLDAHRFEATANDVAGPATGEAYGNVFHWEYTVELRPGNPLCNVRLKQWMYLQTDGTMLNRGTIEKLGVQVAQVTEHFRREAR